MKALLQFYFGGEVGGRQWPQRAAASAPELLSRLRPKLSFNVQLHECDNKAENVQSPRNCCLEESRNLIMLAPPSILLHSTSLDHDQDDKGKICFCIKNVSDYR